MLGVRFLPNNQGQVSLQNSLPPCQEACPLHQDIRDYLFAIATGDFDQSLKIIKETNPLPFICGTICARHCEDECRRADVDQAVSIRGLKRAAVEFGSSPLPPLVKKTGIGKVAVIGGGPSGLTAASDLAGQGCSVTVFEREQAMGGAVRHYIPLYRLPDEAMDRDIEEIAARGIEFCYGRELGRNLTLDQLEKEGYQAILVALGLPVSRGLDLPGIEGEGILYALPFLKQVKREDFRLTGNPTVIVIGGGNVAMDVARSAVRCGAKKVKVVCLESPAEIPAFPWEIEEAGEEGVEFFYSRGPGEISREKGRITGLVTFKCTSVFDDRGRFSPTLEKECRHYISGDLVIFAIGQGGDPEPLRDQLELDERGRLIYNRRTFATSRRGVFACGEMVTGPGTAVESMADGRLAAAAILSFIKGEAFDAERLVKPVAIEKLEPEVREKIIPMARVEIPMLSPSARVCHFNQAELGFDRMMAMDEARRCLGCIAGAERIDDLCANCLTCLRICPYGVPIINSDGAVEIRNEQCQSCGLCVGICPAYAIKFKLPYIEQAAGSIEPAVKKLLKDRNQEPAVLTITCSYGELGTVETDRATIVRYPCVSKIDSLDLLKAVSLGVDGILVISCPGDREPVACQYKESQFWVNRRISHTCAILTELGLEPERVTLAVLPEPSAESFNRVLEEATQKFKELGPSSVR